MLSWDLSLRIISTTFRLTGMGRQNRMCRQLPPHVVAERTPAPTDTDALTKTTIAKMCEYIRAGVPDPVVRQGAQFVAAKFASGRTDPAALAWGVFWFLKHRVKRVLDEQALFRLGEAGQSDMLIAPAVLLRMPEPQEDCDGFTMAAAALLSVLGVESCIITVACDMTDPKRWSHVFGMVHLANGDWMPLDCSHGKQPGWMVPQRQVSRWQAWDLNGNPIDVPPPVRSQLGRYVSTRTPRRGYRFSGLGQICTDADGNIVDCGSAESGVDINSLPITSTAILMPSLPSGGGSATCSNDMGAPVACSDPTAIGVFGSGPPISVIPGTTTPASSTINWGNLLSAALTGGIRTAQIAELPAGSTLTPSGAVISSVNSAVSTLIPIALLGLGAFLVISLLSGAGKR